MGNPITRGSIAYLLPSEWPKSNLTLPTGYKTVGVSGIGIKSPFAVLDLPHELTDFSIVFIGAGGSAAVQLIAYDNSSASQRYFQFFISSDGAGFLRFNTANGYFQANTSGLNRARPYVIIASASGNTVSVYSQNIGEGNFSSAKTAMTGTPRTVPKFIYVGDRSPFNNRYDGVLHGYDVLDRGISFGEAKEICRSPWSLFAQKSRSLWMPGTVSAGTTDTLTSQPITTGAPTLTQAALGQTHALTSQAIATAAPTITTAALGQVHALTSQPISSAAPTITAPALTAASNVDNLIALALSTGAITITQAVLAQHHVLTGQGINTDAPTISQPTLTAAANVNALTVQDITAGPPTISTPGIAQIHVLVGQALSTGAPTIGLPTLGVSGLIYWPTPAQVLAGVSYGPTGADYLGTATGGTGATADEVAAAVWAFSLRSLTLAAGLTPTESIKLMSLSTDNLDVAISSRLAASAYTTPLSPPSAATNALAVRAELVTELARIDAAISSRLPTASYSQAATIDNAAVALAVRAELAAELARLDAAISTRLEALAYVAPAVAPSAATNALAVRTEIAAELTRVMALPDAPANAVAVWSHTQ